MYPNILVISGIDGSGKTAIINGVCAQLRQNGRAVHTPWLRYNHFLTKFVLLAGRLLGLTRYEVVDGYSNGYHEFQRSKVVSWLFLVSTFIDTLFTSVFKVYIPAWLLRRHVVCDRWVPDILIDLAIDLNRPNLPDSIWGRIFWSLIPAGSRCVVVRRDCKAVLKCRPQSASDMTFEPRLRMYEKLIICDRVKCVDNNRPLDQVIMDACNAALS